MPNDFTQNIRMQTIPEYVLRVLCTLENSGHEAWCVGGCVRDALLGRNPEDWDVTSDALPEEVLRIFGDNAIPTGLKHGTVTVRSGGQRVEVTTFRIDGLYLDHRRPEQVTYTRSLKKDLSRRDFTINAMAVNARGKLRDPFGGQKDLAQGILRCVGEPDKRFAEDALRIMRGLRFASALQLAVAPETDNAIRKNCASLREIAVERIQVELVKLLAGKNAASILRQYPEVITVFWREIGAMIGFEQHNPHHCYDVWEHTLHALDAAPCDPLIRCAVLFHDIGKPLCLTMDQSGTGHFYGHAAIGKALAADMLRRLRFDNTFLHTVTLLVAEHDRIIPPAKKGVRRALNRLGEENLRRLILVKRADNMGQPELYRGRQQYLDELERILADLLEENACFSLKQLAVNGRDMLDLGLRGHAIGQILQELLTQVVDGILENDREILLRTARASIASRDKTEHRAENQKAAEICQEKL